MAVVDRSAPDARQGRGCPPGGHGRGPRWGWVLVLVLLAAARKASAAGAALDPEDAALLQRSVTVSWVNAYPQEAIEGLNAALAPGRQLLWDMAMEFRASRSTLPPGGARPVSAVLAAMTPAGWHWSVTRGQLVLAQGLPDPTPGSLPDAHTVGILRRELLAWARAGCDPEQTPDALAGRLPREYWGPVPWGALAHDPHVQAVVWPVLDGLIRADADPPLPILTLAAALAAPQWAPALEAELVRTRQALQGSLSTERRAAQWRRLEALIVALGACDPGRSTAVEPLAAIAAVPLLDVKERQEPELLAFSSVLGLETEERAAITCAIAAIDALGRIGSPEARAALVHLCDRPSTEALSWLAARALARCGDRDALPHVQAAFTAALDPAAQACWDEPSTGEGAIIATAEALLALGGANGCRTVCDLVSQQPSMSLLYALRSARDPAIIPTLLGVIHRDPSLLRKPVEALLGPLRGLAMEVGALTHQPGADAALLARLRAPDVTPAEAETLLLCLGATRSEAALAHLLALVTPPTDDQGRSVACLALALTCQPGAMDALLTRARQDPVLSVRLTALVCVEWLETGADVRRRAGLFTQAAPVLAAIQVQDADAQIRLQAVRVDLEDPDHAKVLRWTQRLLDDPAPSVQAALAVRIGWWTAQRDLVADRSVRNRCLAALALAPMTNAVQTAQGRWFVAVGKDVDATDLLERARVAALNFPVHDRAALEALTVTLDHQHDRPAAHPPIPNTGSP